MNRGDRREAIFADDKDRERFLETLTEACEKTAWRVHAYCLMSNHFHLLIETPQANLVSGMKWLLGTYTSRFNRRHKGFGHPFECPTALHGKPGPFGLAAAAKRRAPGGATRTRFRAAVTSSVTATGRSRKKTGTDNAFFG